MACKIALQVCFLRAYRFQFIKSISDTYIYSHITISVWQWWGLIEFQVCKSVWDMDPPPRRLWSRRVLRIFGSDLFEKDNLFHRHKSSLGVLSKRAKVILKLPVLIGFNESMTFQGNPNNNWDGWFKQNPYQRGPGLREWTALTAGGWGTHYSVTYTEREAGAEREKEMRESRENKCGERERERRGGKKILNDQNSSHKTLGLMPGLFTRSRQGSATVPAAKHVASWKYTKASEGSVEQ